MRLSPLLSAVFLATVACTQTEFEELTTENREAASSNEDVSSDLMSESTDLDFLGPAPMPKSLTREEICKQLTALAPATCKSLLPVLGNVLKKGWLDPDYKKRHPNFQSDFCEEACKDQGIFKRPICKKACNSFISQSPGPYSGLGSKFHTDACAEATTILRAKIADYCAPVRPPVAKPFGN
jgi:hypothetical protein